MGTLRTTALAAVAAIAVPALVLTACSDDDSAEAERPEPSAADPAGEAEAAVRSFYEDFAADELKSACAWWTDDYAAHSVVEWNEGGYGPRVTSCPELLGAIREVFTVVGDPSDLLQVTDASGELTDDTTARVTVSLASDDEERETYELTLTDDGWRISGDDAR